MIYVYKKTTKSYEFKKVFTVSYYEAKITAYRHVFYKNYLRIIQY